MPHTSGTIHIHARMSGADEEESELHRNADAGFLGKVFGMFAASPQH